MGVLIITHYQRILHFVKPSHVHVLYRGRIVKEGGPELVEQLEAKGYGWITDAIDAAERCRRRLEPAAERVRSRSWRDVAGRDRVPGAAPGGGRAPAGLPGLGRDVADTAGRDRRDRRLLHDHRASVHRGVYPLIVEATELFEGARERIAAWLGSTVEETIFTANATASINLVAHSWGRVNLEPGDLVLVTEMEHHSDVVPWQLICAERGAELAYIPFGADGSSIRTRTRLLEREPEARLRSPTSRTCSARSTRSPR